MQEIRNKTNFITSFYYCIFLLLLFIDVVSVSTTAKTKQNKTKQNKNKEKMYTKQTKREREALTSIVYMYRGNARVFDVNIVCVCGRDEFVFLWLVAKPRAMRHPCPLLTGSRICPGQQTVHSHA